MSNLCLFYSAEWCRLRCTPSLHVRTHYCTNARITLSDAGYVSSPNQPMTVLTVWFRDSSWNTQVLVKTHQPPVGSSSSCSCQNQKVNQKVNDLMNHCCNTHCIFSWFEYCYSCACGSIYWAVQCQVHGWPFLPAWAKERKIWTNTLFVAGLEKKENKHSSLNHICKAVQHVADT